MAIQPTPPSPGFAPTTFRRCAPTWTARSTLTPTVPGGRFTTRGLAFPHGLGEARRDPFGRARRGARTGRCGRRREEEAQEGHAVGEQDHAGEAVEHRVQRRRELEAARVPELAGDGPLLHRPGYTADVAPVGTAYRREGPLRGQPVDP